MSKSFYFCNGKYVASDKATVSIHDIGLLRGYAIFESLRTYDGSPFLLREHIVRMFQGLNFSNIRPRYNPVQLEKLVRAAIQKNSKLKNVLIRIIITGGPTQSLVPLNNPTVLVLVDPLHAFPEWQYTKGIALKTTSYPRVIPSIKSTVYFSAVLETQRALKQNYHEVVYTDSKGRILEGSTFNVFAVLPGPRLVTARDDVLAGVTADCVVRIAKRLGITVERSPISNAHLKKAKEMFITSSNRELIPAVKVDKIKIGNGKPGPVTKKLHEEYLREVKKRCAL